MILLVIKLLIKLQRISHKIIQRLIQTEEKSKEIQLNTNNNRNVLDNTPNQLSNFRTKILVEIYYGLREMYGTNSQIKFKAAISRLSKICDYNEAYIIATTNYGTKK